MFIPFPTKNVLLASTVALLAVLTTAPSVQAGSGWDDDDDWEPRRARTVVIEKSVEQRPREEVEIIEEPVRRPPVVERTVVMKQPIVRPVVHKTVVIERPVIQRVVHRTVVKRPVYVQHVVQRPVEFRRRAFVHRGWHERRRCYLPEREFCR